MSRSLDGGVFSDIKAPGAAETTSSCHQRTKLKLIVKQGFHNYLLVVHRQAPPCNPCTLEEFQNTRPQKMKGSRSPFDNTLVIIYITDISQFIVLVGLMVILRRTI